MGIVARLKLAFLVMLRVVLAFLLLPLVALAWVVVPRAVHWKGFSGVRLLRRGSLQRTALAWDRVLPL
jgi:hypothetical protein